MYKSSYYTHLFHILKHINRNINIKGKMKTYMYCEYIAESFALLQNFGQEAVYCNLEIYICSPPDE